MHGFARGGENESSERGRAGRESDEGRKTHPGFCTQPPGDVGKVTLSALSSVPKSAISEGPSTRPCSTSLQISGSTRAGESPPESYGSLFPHQLNIKLVREGDRIDKSCIF